MAGITREARAAMAEVRGRFESKELDEERFNTLTGLERLYVKLATEVQRTLPEGRNKALSLTALEDSLMRATRALAHDVPAAQEEGEEEQPAAVVEEERPRRVPRRRRVQPDEAAPASEPASEGHDDAA